MTRPSSRRLALLSLALLAAALAADAAWGQPGFRPGGPRPGGVPNPGGIPGQRPPGFPGPAGNPRPPVPAPPFVPPAGRPNVLPGVPVTVWSCSHCKAELARGGGTPALATCPVCGVRFVNGTQSVAPGGVGPAPAGVPQIVPAVAFAAPPAAGAPGGRGKPALDSPTFRTTVGVGAAVWGGMVVLGALLTAARRPRGDAVPDDGH